MCDNKLHWPVAELRAVARALARRTSLDEWEALSELALAWSQIGQRYDATLPGSASVTRWIWLYAVPRVLRRAAGARAPVYWPRGLSPAVSVIVDTSRLAVPAEQCSAAERAEMVDIVASAVDRLPLRWRIIVVQSYGLGGAQPLSGEDIARRLGITGARVGQIRRQALKRIIRIMCARVESRSGEEVAETGPTTASGSDPVRLRVGGPDPAHDRGRPGHAARDSGESMPDHPGAGRAGSGRRRRAASGGAEALRRGGS